MELGPGFRQGCRPASGDQEDMDRLDCKAFTGANCDFQTGVVFNITTNGLEFTINGTGTPFDRCLFLGQGLNTVLMEAYQRIVNW